MDLVVCSPPDRTLAGKSEPWPLVFTTEDKRANSFAWADVGAGSESWDAFAGFYDYYPVKGVKDKAVVLAGLAHRKTARRPAAKTNVRTYWSIVPQAPAVFFYIGSGEFWRLRSKTLRASRASTPQMVRHVSQEDSCATRNAAYFSSITTTDATF